MSNPIDILNQWLFEERERGAPNPQQAVLSTATQEAIPHARLVAIREINDQNLLFFTQKGTRKVSELNANPHATLTFWFELFQREVIIEGAIETLSEVENTKYWEHYPREAQLRFLSYAPTSMQPIVNKQILEDIKKKIEFDFLDKPLPVSQLYCGFRLKPVRFVFYAYRMDELSDVFEYSHIDEGWLRQLLSP